MSFQNKTARPWNTCLSVIRPPHCLMPQNWDNIIILPTQILNWALKTPSHQNFQSFSRQFKFLKHYRDNVIKFEAGYGKLWKPFGNEDNKQSDCVIIFWNSYGYSKKLCLAYYSLSSFFERNEFLEMPLTISAHL